jgi:hypothetical protein
MAINITNFDLIIIGRQTQIQNFNVERIKYFELMKLMFIKLFEKDRNWN